MHDVRVDGGRHLPARRAVAPHLRLDLMQLAPAIDHHFDDVVHRIAVPAVELHAFQFHVAVDAVQSFHLQRSNVSHINEGISKLPTENES